METSLLVVVGLVTLAASRNVDPGKGSDEFEARIQRLVDGLTIDSKVHQRKEHYAAHAPKNNNPQNEILDVLQSLFSDDESKHELKQTHHDVNDHQDLKAKEEIQNVIKRLLQPESLGLQQHHEHGHHNSKDKLHIQNVNMYFKHNHVNEKPHKRYGEETNEYSISHLLCELTGRCTLPSPLDEKNYDDRKVDNEKTRDNTVQSILQHFEKHITDDNNKNFKINNVKYVNKQNQDNLRHRPKENFKFHDKRDRFDSPEERSEDSDSEVTEEEYEPSKDGKDDSSVSDGDTSDGGEYNRYNDRRFRDNDEKDETYKTHETKDTYYNVNDDKRYIDRGDRNKNRYEDNGPKDVIHEDDKNIDEFKGIKKDSETGDVTRTGDNLRCGCTGNHDLRCGDENLRCGCIKDNLRCGCVNDNLRCSCSKPHDLRCSCSRPHDLRCNSAESNDFPSGNQIKKNNLHQKEQLDQLVANNLLEGIKAKKYKLNDKLDAIVITTDDVEDTIRAISNILKEAESEKLRLQNTNVNVRTNPPSPLNLNDKIGANEPNIHSNVNNIRTYLEWQKQLITNLSLNYMLNPKLTYKTFEDNKIYLNKDEKDFLRFARNAYSKKLIKGTIEDFRKALSVVWWNYSQRTVKPEYGLKPNKRGPDVTRGIIAGYHSNINTDPIKKMKSKILPLSKKQRSKTAFNHSLISHHNRRSLNDYGFPFHLDVEGLGQVKP